MKIKKLLVSCLLVLAVTVSQAAVVDVYLNNGEGVSYNGINGVLTDPETLLRANLNRHYAPSNLTSLYRTPGSGFIVRSGSVEQLVVEGNSCFYVGSLLLNCGETSRGDELPLLPGTDTGGDQQGSEGDDSLIGSGGTTVVPVPAAVWLFGSALIGLFSAGRRKS